MEKSKSDMSTPLGSFRPVYVFRPLSENAPNDFDAFFSGEIYVLTTDQAKTSNPGGKVFRILEPSE